MSLNFESNKIRIAVVGCGRISNNHFQSIEMHNDKIELTAICDNNENVLIQFEKKKKT